MGGGEWDLGFSVLDQSGWGFGVVGGGIGGDVGGGGGA